MSFKSLLTNYKELVITPTPQNSFNNSYLSFSYYIKPTTAQVQSSAICKANDGDGCNKSTKKSINSSKKSKIMNALFELLGKKYTKETFDSIVRMGTDFDDCTIETEKDSFGREIVSVCPKWEATATKEWFKLIKFAKVDCNETSLSLPSTRTEEDELAFFKGLASINYYNGYGGQELYGIIAFNDGTWLDRGEYDGSEWWQKNSFPREEDYIGGEQE